MELYEDPQKENNETNQVKDRNKQISVLNKRCGEGSH